LVALSIMGDTVYEPTEGLALELSQARGTALENHSAATVIENDDPLGAFTASGRGSINGHCVAPRSDAVAGLVEAMDDLGYSVQSYRLREYDFNEDWGVNFQSVQSALMGSIFQDGEFARVLEGEAILFLPGCAPPSQFPWSIDLQLEIVAFDADPDTSEVSFGPLMRASVGEATINRDNVQTVGGEFVLAITGDQLAYDEFEQAAVAAGYDPAMLNLLRVPDILVPDGGGSGGVTDLFSEDQADFPTPLLGITWNIHHEGYGTSHTENLLPGDSKIFSRQTERPRQPFALEGVNPTSANHESLVAKYSQDFDDLVGAVVAHFENERGFSLVSDRSFASQNGVVSNGVGGFTFEGGQACIDAELDCGHNTNDTLYAWTGDSVFLDSDDIYYVVVGLDYTLLDQMGGPMASQAVVEFAEVVDPGAGGGINNFYAGQANREVRAARRELPLRTLPNWPGDNLSSVVTENSFVIQVTTDANCPAGLDQAAICFTTFVASPQAFISKLTLNPVTGTRPDPDQVIPWRLLQFEAP
ncbi:MAG: hypothetical protein AAGF23_17780, partial [Acidobacteriota bacterium]